MTFLSKVAIFSAVLSSASVFASTYEPLGVESSDAIYHLSKYCGEELGVVKKAYSNSWIGSGGKWANANNNYGYNFEVFYSPNYFNTEKLATLSLSAQYIPNPPADASKYKYTCRINWVN